MTPTKGFRFNNKRVLDTRLFDGKTPQLYQVTRIAGGMIWFAPVYDYGFTNERLGSSDKCPLEYFPRIAMEVSK